jgi:hypothetical protein
MKQARIPRVLLPALLAVALILPATAKATGPQHSNFSGTFTDVDLCGISTTLTFSGVDNFFPVFDASGNLIAFKDTHQELDVFTAANGKSIENHFVNPSTATITTNPDGTVTLVQTYKGLLSQLSTPNGPVLARDAGIITFVNLFDSSGNLISQTFLVVAGPHPDAASGFTLFCQVVTAALS